MFPAAPAGGGSQVLVSGARGIAQRRALLRRVGRGALAGEREPLGAGDGTGRPVGTCLALGPRRWCGGGLALGLRGDDVGADLFLSSHFVHYGTLRAFRPPYGEMPMHVVLIEPRFPANQKLFV